MEFGRPRASAFARRGKGAGIQHRSESRRVRGRGCARSFAHPHRAALGGDTNFMPIIGGARVLSDGLRALYDKLMEAQTKMASPR